MLIILGWDISYGTETDWDKSAKFRNICGTIDKSLKNNTTKDKRIKFYKIVAFPLCV